MSNFNLSPQTPSNSDTVEILMKKILRSLTPFKSHKPPCDTLIDFLVQCDVQGFHFQFPSSMSKPQLKALIEPLNLSRKEAQQLLRTHLEPTSTFTLGPCEFFTSMNQQDPQSFPCQVCKHCAPGLFEHYGDSMADTTWCSQCREKRECLDVALIEHYRKHGIADETIGRQLPKIRWTCNSDSFAYQSIEAIETIYQSVFEAARKNTNAVK